MKTFASLFRRLRGRETSVPSATKPAWSLFQYVDDAGNFDYGKYRNAQIQANKRKLERVWVQKENIEFLSSLIRARIGRARFGLCHGTRRGLEQQWFIEALECEVVGTEISDTASDFPNTVQWDFHETKPEWINSVDFIYSNSLDHSYDPERCINAWMSCLTKNGLLFLEHSSDDVASKESDPFGADLLVMPYLILLWSKGAFYVTQIIAAPKKSRFGNKEYPTYFLVIEHRRSSSPAPDTAAGQLP